MAISNCLHWKPEKETELKPISWSSLLSVQPAQQFSISLGFSSGSEHSRDPIVSHPSTAVELTSGTELEYVGKGYHLVNCENLSQSVSKVGVCNACGSTFILREDLVTRRGLVSKLVICCTNTACSNEATFSNPYSAESKSLNARSILGMWEIGREQASLEYFCGWIDMLPSYPSNGGGVYGRCLAEHVCCRCSSPQSTWCRAH